MKMGQIQRKNTENCFDENKPASATEFTAMMIDSATENIRKSSPTIYKKNESHGDPRKKVCRKATSSPKNGNNTVLLQ
jgi:hypothetical protein